MKLNASIWNACTRWRLRDTPEVQWFKQKLGKGPQPPVLVQHTYLERSSACMKDVIHYLPCMSLLPVAIENTPLCPTSSSGKHKGLTRQGPYFFGWSPFAIHHHVQLGMESADDADKAQKLASPVSTDFLKFSSRESCSLPAIAHGEVQD